MEFQTVVEIAKQTGIAGAALGAIVFLVLKIQKQHSEEMTAMRKERQETHAAFMAFVDTNNHQKTELVKESTSAIVTATRAIELHTELLRQHINQK